LHNNPEIWNGFVQPHELHKNHIVSASTAPRTDAGLAILRPHSSLFLDEQLAESRVVVDGVQSYLR
jgi:hypothetical protein